MYVPWSNVQNSEIFTQKIVFRNVYEGIDGALSGVGIILQERGLASYSVRKIRLYIKKAA